MARAIQRLRGLFVLLATLMIAGYAEGNASIEGFKLTECGPKKCLTVESPSAYIGAFQFKMYAFDDAVVKIYDLKSKKEKTIKTRDGYYDVNLNRVFLRNVNGNPLSEAIYDLRSERLHMYNLGAL